LLTARPRVAAAASSDRRTRDFEACTGDERKHIGAHIGTEHRTGHRF